MDVRLSPEQAALRDAAAAVVRDLAPTSVGSLADTERAAKLDAAVAAAGWRELRCPSGDDAGAPWASGVEVAVVAEELGRAAADSAFLGPTLAAELRRLAAVADPEPAVGGGETVLLSPDLGSFGDAVAIDAAGAAAALTVVDGNLRRLPLDVDQRRTDVDLTRPSTGSAGSNWQPEQPEPAASAASSTLGTVTDDDLDRVTALALATTAADLVGCMQGAVDLSVAYVTERRQYGQPVGAFQAVQHLLADALALTEGARSATLHAAWAVDALPAGEAVVAAASAKAYAARAARTVCETAIQVHGGIGNTWECMAHVFLRRALVSAAVLGGVDACLQRVLASRGL